jgi:hypothetical protein
MFLRAALGISIPVFGGGEKGCINDYQHGKDRLAVKKMTGFNKGKKELVCRADKELNYAYN